MAQYLKTFTMYSLKFSSKDGPVEETFCPPEISTPVNPSSSF